MKLKDVDTDVSLRMSKIRNKLKESYGIDVSKYATKDAKRIASKLRVLENRSNFSKHIKNPEWKKMSLMIEYFKLQEGKGQIGPSKGDTAHEKMFKKMDQSGNAKGFKSAAKKPTDDKYSKMAKKHGVKEGTQQHAFVKLMESELERSEIILGARNIVEDVQDMVESLSKTKVEKLSPLVERIKAEFGLDMAETFNESVGAQLEAALDSLSGVKELIDTETLRLSGDIEPEAVQDFGGDDEMGDPEMDLDVDADMGGDPEMDLDVDADMDDGEMEPLDRELKEGKKIAIELITTKGTRGKKFFESRKQMKNWVNKNQDKIGKILGVK